MTKTYSAKQSLHRYRDDYAAEQELLVRVGERVRAAREHKAIPRRVLSELSGVSPRYLAQLEAGDGNISIALLHRVATALDLRIEHLIGESDVQASDDLHVLDRFNRANSETQAQVRAILGLNSADFGQARRIALIGLRGAGKSTLGRLAGRELGIPFVELNSVIAEDSGMPVTELVALYGQEGYRRLEALALEQVVARHERVILAVAGGIVAEPDTYATLLARFHTVWIKASPEEHMDRVREQGDTRPMAGNPAAMSQLKSILTLREAFYGRAGAVVDTSGLSVETSKSDLCALIKSRNFLG